MKKTAIALSIAAITLAGATNAAEVYNHDGKVLDLGGRAEARLSTIGSDSQDESRARVQISGKTDLKAGFYGIGVYESEFRAGNTIDTRHVYAGLGHEDYGVLTYGQNDAALGLITGFTDIGNNYTGSATAKIKISDRDTNMLTYFGEFDNLQVKAAYHFANRDDSSGVSKNDKTNGYSLATTYAFGDSGFKLGTGIARQKRIKDDGKVGTTEQNIKNQTQYMAAGSYTKGILYFGAFFTHINHKNYDVLDVTKYSGKYNGYELATSIQATDKLKFISTYNLAKTNKVKTVNKVTAEANYKFQDDLYGYAIHSFNLLDTKTAGSKVAGEDISMIGLKYTF